MQDLVKTLFEHLEDKNMMLVTAESCTGGGLGAAITGISGSSEFYDRGFIIYSNRAKTQMLGVPADLIAEKGAVSPEVAETMAHGAISHSDADIALSITGVAGPTGGTDEKPVGTVYFGCMIKGHKAQHFKHHFGGDREDVRKQSVEAGLRILITALETA